VTRVFDEFAVPFLAPTRPVAQNWPSLSFEPTDRNDNSWGSSLAIRRARVKLSLHLALWPPAKTMRSATKRTSKR